MPGMDGFQAIQAIKGNPDTAMIPVVMYTSQEGELYVSQARALGAVGVLPKTVKQVDVSRVLYQLRLLPERREARAGAPATRAQRHRRGAARRRRHRHRRNRGRDPQRDRPAAQGTQLGDAALRAREPRSLRTPHRTETKPAAAPPARRRSRSQRAAPPPPSRWPLVAAIAALALLPTIVLAVLHTRHWTPTRELAQSNTKLAALTCEEQQAQLARSAPGASQGREAAERCAGRGAHNRGGGRGIRARSVRRSTAGGRPARALRDLLDAAQGRRLSRHGQGRDVRRRVLPDRQRHRRLFDGRRRPAGETLRPARQSVRRRSEHRAAPVAARSPISSSSIRQDTADRCTVEVAHDGRKPSVPYPRGDQLAKADRGRLEQDRLPEQSRRVCRSAGGFVNG